MYNMIPHKSKAMHVEDDIINFCPIRQKINSYTRKEKNACDYSSMVLLYGEHLGDIIIAVNTDLKVNRIMEIR